MGIRSGELKAGFTFHECDSVRVKDSSKGYTNILLSLLTQITSAGKTVQMFRVIAIDSSNTTTSIWTYGGDERLPVQSKP